MFSAASSHSSRERLGQLAELARRAGDVADLDVVRVERGGGVEQQPPAPVGVRARRLARIDEEVGQELDLEVASGRRRRRSAFISLSVLRLELVLDVGVPQADALEADAGRLGAAVAPVERAPFATDVHLGGTATVQ